MASIEYRGSAGLERRGQPAFRTGHAYEVFRPPTPGPMDIRTIGGALVRAPIADLSLAEVGSDAQLMHHVRTQFASPRPSLFFLHVQIEGESVNRQGGREAALKAGDFTLCDGTRHYEATFAGPARMLVLGVPEAKLRRHIACPESLVAVPMSGSQGVSGLLSRFLCGYWSDCSRELGAGAAERVSLAVLDLLGAAYADVPRPQSGPASLGSAHRIRIINYIESNLHDPDLTPTRIAEACKITPRYLHHLFSDQDETVARYILRRRLDACARALESGAQRGRTVTAIAFDHGFNSPTHFGRVFRAKFGVTPREYRRTRARCA
jgi:AraC-like DNA-binding protein